MSTDIVLLTGPPGTGKTTTARALAAQHERAVHLRTDDFFRSIVSGGIAPHRSAAEAQNQTVMQVIRATSAGYARGGFTTIVDGIMGPWMLPLLRPLNTLDGIRTHWIVLRADHPATLGRAQARTGPLDLVDEEPITCENGMICTSVTRINARGRSVPSRTMPSSPASGMLSPAVRQWRPPTRQSRHDHRRHGS